MSFKNRIKILEIRRFFINLKNDYLYSSNPGQLYKLECFINIVRNILITIWSGLTAPFIYPIWFLFRKRISNRVYKNISWQDIKLLIDNNSTKMVKEELLKSGRFYYWLWTYGDINDPLNRGGLPDGQKNNFLNRFLFSAIRNPRFNINYLEFRTGLIVESHTIIDTRNFNYKHGSDGIGDSPDGICFKWFKDENEKWYFIYEDNNSENLFYIGYTGLLKDKKVGRFELGYRRTKFSHQV